MRVNILSWFRQTHLYIGVFAAPAILFFAVTGFLQTFSFHEPSNKPDKWLVLLAQIHKKQIAQLPPPRVAPPPSTATASVALQKKADPAPRGPSGESYPKHNPLPLKLFFAVVCASLITSTFSGLYLSWKYRRNRFVLTALFLAGIIAPLLLMRI